MRGRIDRSCVERAAHVEDTSGPHRELLAATARGPGGGRCAPLRTIYDTRRPRAFRRRVKESRARLDTSLVVRAAVASGGARALSAGRGGEALELDRRSGLAPVEPHGVEAHVERLRHLL